MSTTINKNIFAFLLVVSMLCALKNYAQQTLTPASSGYAPVNGSKVYYEVYGAGDPIVLLHGAYMTINSTLARAVPLALAGPGATDQLSARLGARRLDGDLVAAAGEVART